MCRSVRLDADRMFSDLGADYSIAGRKEVVRALEDICLAPNSELYPIRRYA